eukprot:597588-Pelagomonas_calceolata.AAC.3
MEGARALGDVCTKCSGSYVICSVLRALIAKQVRVRPLLNGCPTPPPVQSYKHTKLPANTPFKKLTGDCQASTMPA